MAMGLRNKNIVVAVCGGIAAYKSAVLVRELQRLGAHVRVAMSDSATNFVTPLTFQALSGYPVHIKDGDQLDPNGMDHIALARWSDAIVIVPATANIIAKIAHGVADSFISTLCLAHKGILAIAPAMMPSGLDAKSTRLAVPPAVPNGTDTAQKKTHRPMTPIMAPISGRMNSRWKTPR